MDLLWNSASLRLSCAVAFSRCAWATLRFAWAWVRLLRGMRGSILARSVPLLTSSPVWTGISRISPEAFDFTLSVRIGWIAPEAVDRKSTRLNSSHSQISYAVFCLKKKKKKDKKYNESTYIYIHKNTYA